MKILLSKKIYVSFFIITLLQFVLSPTKLLALDYQTLVPDAFSSFGQSNDKGNLSLFLTEAFQFGLALAAALAVVMIVWGGVEIMLSESIFKKEDGKKKIEDAIWGLLLALISYLILYTINPTVLSFKI